MNVYIYADQFFYPASTKGPGYLELVNGKFGKYSSIRPEEPAHILDYSGKWIAPGLVDTHIHGYQGYNVMTEEVSELENLSEALLSCGVTSFLPSTLTSSSEELTAVAQTIRKAQLTATGAKIQGIFFEGPFFTEEHKGAQNAIHFRDPDLSLFNEWQNAANGLIRKIALAPERTGSEPFIEKMHADNIVVGLGHSSATLDQAQAALNDGASLFIHAFNAMSGLQHRNPGMAGAMLASPHSYAELICDGYHVHPDVCRILMEKIGHHRVALISDCMMASGLPDGEYHLGDLSVTVANGLATLPSGNLASSLLTMKDAIKNVVDWNIATPEQAIMMASLIPARSSNIDHLCGMISPGRDADFIVLNSDMTLEATYLNGNKCFSER